MAKSKKKELSSAESENILKTLKARFEKNLTRHRGVEWMVVEERLKANPSALRSLHEMEETGGEPDVVGREKNGALIFFDCSAETPAGRRSLCYDDEALEARKEHKPEGSAKGMAASMGIELLDEEQYRRLQALGKFDTKTSSWIETPEPIRKLGGSLFGDRRYNHVFIYHNGAQSYYAARGFRGWISV